jgi:hypothetical protein
MEDLHQAWNDRQKVLREALIHSPDPAVYLPLFLEHHAYVHPHVEDSPIAPTFEDEVWQGLSDAQAKAIPWGMEHSIAWCIWHLTRIEDVVMHLLIAGEHQMLDSGSWGKKPGLGWPTTGNEQSLEEVATLSRDIDIAGLRAYRLAVTLDTHRIVTAMQPEILSQKPAPESVERLYLVGALVRTCPAPAEYWAGLTIAGLLLMPPTRHSLIHLNECEKIKSKVLKA